MPFEVSEVKSLEEFSLLVPVEWESYSTPHNAFWEVLKGPSIEECTQRQWVMHTADPNSHWLKITNETGTVIGGGQWVINQENPFKKPMPEIAATWWPEGSGVRDLSDKILEKFFSGRPGRMNRPHLRKLA